MEIQTFFETCKKINPEWIENVIKELNVKFPIIKDYLQWFVVFQ